MSSTTIQSSKASDLRPLLARITRDQGPEFEQTLAFAALSQVSTPTSLRTDRKIKALQFHFRGRLTNAATGPTLRAAPQLLSMPLAVNATITGNTSGTVFSLIQQITIRGQHLKYGSQTIFQMRGEAIAEFMALTLPNYIPQYTVLGQTSGSAIRGANYDVTASHTNDIEFNLPVLLYPPGCSCADAVMYCVHGPDWPGNLFVDVLFADGTAIGTANASTITFSAYGAGTGSPSVDILSERPLLGKDYMSAIRGAITYRISFTGQPTNAVVNTGGSGQKLADLQVGKDTSRIFMKFGSIAGANQSAGVTAFTSLSDLIATRTFVALDSRGLRFQNTNDDAALQDYMARSYGRSVPIGYKMIDFISTTSGPYNPANPKACFGSSQLTAARKFEVDADITAAANQSAEVTQEMILGAPGINQ